MGDLPKYMVAVDPEALASLQAEIAALREEIKAVKMIPKPDWVDSAEYAKQIGVTRRTIMNWISNGQIDSRRQGSKVFVRSNPAA